MTVYLVPVLDMYKQSGTLKLKFGLNGSLLIENALFPLGCQHCQVHYINMSPVLQSISFYKHQCTHTCPNYDPT